jgi:hypothetical protein
MPIPSESVSFKGSYTHLPSSVRVLLFYINSIVFFISSTLPPVDLSVNTLAYIPFFDLNTIAELTG